MLYVFRMIPLPDNRSITIRDDHIYWNPEDVHDGAKDDATLMQAWIEDIADVVDELDMSSTPEAPLMKRMLETISDNRCTAAELRLALTQNPSSGPGSKIDTSACNDKDE